MAPIREIPGFYYDEERKKYFRIQADHRAPAGASHSKSAIKAKKEVSTIEQECQRRQTQAQNGQVLRHDPSSFTSLSLALRLGRRPSRILETFSRNYVARLQRSYATYNGQAELKAFTFMSDGRLFTVHHGLGSDRRPFVVSNTVWDKGCRSPSSVPLGVQQATSTWITLAPVAGQHIVCGSGSNLILKPVNDDNLDEPLMINTVYHETSFTDVAGHPDVSRIAAASNNGLYLGELPLHRPSPHKCQSLRKEQMVVTFKDPNIIMSGERSGAMNFTDFRVPSTIHRLQHSSAVNGIVTGRNQNHVIVSGLGTISLYDLRFIKSAAAAAQPRKRKPHSQTKSSHPLVPFYVPRSHQSDHYTPGKNLVYIPSLDVAVVACHRTAPYKGGVLCYNASTGQLIHSPVLAACPAYDRGLAVARVRDGAESIFVGGVDGISEYGVDVLDDAENEGGIVEGGGVDRGIDLLKMRFPLRARPEMAEMWR